MRELPYDLLKTVSFAALTVVLACGAAKPATFEGRLQSLKPGSARAEVRDLLGVPEKIFTPADHPGTWTAGTSEVWSYGLDRGAVYFDTSTHVQFVYGRGGRIAPPEPHSN